MSVWKEPRFLRRGNYLHGSFIKHPEIDGYINSLNPGNLDDPIGKFPFSESAADSAVGCAREAFPMWHRGGLEARVACVHRLRDQLAAHMEQLATLITRETGKPLWEAHAEVLATIKRIDVTLEHGIPQLEGWRLKELEGGCEFHPRGVIAVLGAYSLPLLVPHTHLIPALLAGNVVILKPSKYTPAVGQLIAQMFDMARFPRGVFGMVQGSGRVVGSRLATHPDVDAVHMDGSLETAYELRKLTLNMPWKRLVLNACGRGTAIVLDDADVDKAAYEIIVGAFLTTGQRRSSTTRVIVTRSIADALIERLVQITQRLHIGHGFDDNIYMGPLISEAARRRFQHYLDVARKEGHEELRRGGRLDREPRGYYVSPSILLIHPNIKRHFPSNELIVGPALEIHIASSFDEAAEIHNQSRLRLVTSLFTQDEMWVKEARYCLQTGVLNLNRSTVSLSARLPLEGQFGSSNGIPMGLFAIRACSYPLAFLEDSRPFDPNAVMPGIDWPEDEDDGEVTAVRQIDLNDTNDKDESGEKNENTVSDFTLPPTPSNLKVEDDEGLEVTPPMAGSSREEGEE